jgi:hypothetical protein
MRRGPTALARVVCNTSSLEKADRQAAPRSHARPQACHQARQDAVTTNKARLLIESIDTSTLVGLRDRATSSRSSRRRKAARGDIPGGLEFQGRRGSGLLRSLLRRAVAPFRHELIEFRLVLGLAQACQEVPELALLVLQALERIGAVFVEGTIAAGTVAPHQSPRPRKRSILSWRRSILRCQRSP